MFLRRLWMPASGGTGPRRVSSRRRRASRPWRRSAGSTRLRWRLWKPPADTRSWRLRCCGATPSRPPSSTPGTSIASPKRWASWKTDRIDAGVIAWYADAKRIVAQEPASQAQERLKALVTRLRQLTELRTMQSNQRRLVGESDINRMFGEIMAMIARQTRELEHEIAALIDADPLWQKLDECFRSIKGVADRTVSRIMAEMPEIGTLSNKAVAKLAGLAPLAKDSGKSQGKRITRGGRANLRNILFVIVENVRRYNPDFAAFHKRLTEAGKAKKVIRIALAHKLLVQLNAKARDVRQELALAA